MSSGRPGAVGGLKVCVSESLPGCPVTEEGERETEGARREVSVGFGLVEEKFISFIEGNERFI